MFYLTRKHSLNKATPLEALIDGRLEDVMGTAKAFADR